MRIFCFFVLLQGLLFAEPTYLSFPSDISWKSMESPHFHIIYRFGQKEFAKRTLKAAERAYGLLKPIFPEVPSLTSIVLADFRDSLNGYSLNFPFSHFVIFAAPPDSANELSSLDHWLDSVVLHEFVHTLHLYPAKGLWKWVRKMFGTWVVPNGMMPSHLHEGLATFLETEFSRAGRGRSPFFSMLTRKAVEKNLWATEFLPLDLLDGAASLWPHGVSPYYFGYYFYEHLWKKKGSQGIQDLTLAASSNWPYFVNSPYSEVFGHSVLELWTEISTEQKEKLSQENERIRREPLSTLSYFTHTQFQKKEVALSPNRRRAAFLSSRPGKGQLLETLEWPSGKPLKEFPLLFSEAGGFCWQEENNQDSFLLATPHQENFYVTNRLTLFKPTEEHRFNLKAQNGPIEHVHEFSCSSDLKNILMYQESGGKGSLGIYSFERTGTFDELNLKAQWSLPENAWISSVSYGDINLFLLREGDETFFYRWAPPAAPVAFGKIKGHAYGLKQRQNQIYLIAPLSGRNEVWRLDQKNKKLIKTIAVSGGINFFEPTEGQFLVSSYEHGGFDLALASPLTQPIEVPLESPEHSPEQPGRELPGEEKEYSPLPYLIPRTWIPSALLVPFGFQAGAWIPMFDLSQKHFYDFTLGIDQRNTNEGTKILPYLSGLYGYRFGRSGSFQGSAYYSPSFLVVTRSFFKRWGASASFSHQLGNLPIQGTLSSLIKKVEPSDLGPANQSIGLGFELGWRSDTLQLNLNHQQFFQPMGSLDNYFSSWASFEAFFKSPVWNSALWYLSLKQGYTEGTALLNSFFEGGGELLFSQGRGFFLNRGYLPGSFAARRIFGGNLELRFPITTIDRGAGLLPFFLQNVSAAWVLDTTSFDRGVKSPYKKIWLKEFLWSTGVELKSQWKFFYYLPTQIRFGAYRGLSAGGEAFYFNMGVEASL